MQEGETTLQFKGEQTSESSSKISLKLGSVRLKTIHLCALAVIWALDLGSGVLGQAPRPSCHPQLTQPSCASLRGKTQKTSLQRATLLNSHDQTLLQ